MHPKAMVSVSQDLCSAMSLVAALAILCIAFRYWRMGPPAVLSRFGRARCVLHTACNPPPPSIYF